MSGELAITISGIVLRRPAGFPVPVALAAFALAPFARDGATRFGSPSILRNCIGHGASFSPDASSRAASSSSASSDPAASSIRECGSPIVSNRAGMVATVKSAGSQSGTSSHVSGAETRASGSGRTE